MLKTLLSTLICFMEFLFNLLVDLKAVDEYKKIVKKPFVCPNCGQEFYKKWYHLWLTGFSESGISNKAKLKCPHCKETDACRWTGMDRV